MEESKEQQQFFMRQALKVGQRGRRLAPSNPWVGCVIVQGSKVVGEGHHEGPGTAHAEVRALEQAGSLAKGATVYVTLEPCSHTGRTPPCVNALIQAKVAHVVIPFEDPDSKVAGRGVAALRQAGIEVTIGCCVEEAKEELAPYLLHRSRKLPYVVLKAAPSLDGRMALQEGSSQWITGEEARANAHGLRADSSAILIGAETALKDRPKLTVRGIEPFRPPLRVLLDGRGRVPAEGPLFDEEAPLLIFTTESAPIERREQWRRAGATVEVLGLGPQIPLKDLLKNLGERPILQLLVEGGPHLLTQFLKERLAQRMILYMGNVFLGKEGIPLFQEAICTMDAAPRFSLLAVQRLGKDLRLDYSLNPEIVL